MKRINKFIKKIGQNKFFSIVFIPLILLIFWAVVSLAFYHKISFSVLTYVHNNEVVIKAPETKLLKNEKISGEFKAKDNYLGIVMLRFKNFVKPDYVGEDALVFRLKEKGDKNWYQSASYRSGALETNLLFPFGISTIDNSKGKTYQFEIESLYGNDRNAVTLGKDSMLITGYQYSKAEIMGSKIRMASFLYRKALSSFTDSDFVLGSLIYLLPFLIYVFLKFVIRKSKIDNFIFVIILASIMLDIFVIKEFYSGIILILTIGWLYYLWRYKIGSKINFILSFILIIFWIILILFKIDNFQNKINSWLYLFLVMGAIQSVIEERHSKKS